jgi:hypothetical protein
VRWLIDEMLPAGVVQKLRDRGHDAKAAVEELRGLTDMQLFEVAVEERRVLVTENVVDFVALLEQRLASGGAGAPVVFVLKRALPRDAGRLAESLAARLHGWAGSHPDPFPSAYWLEARR